MDLQENLINFNLFFSQTKIFKTKFKDQEW